MMHSTRFVLNFLGNVCSEVYSLPRMIRAASKVGMAAGFALVLATVDEDGNQLDFSQERMRAKAHSYLMTRNRPY